MIDNKYTNTLTILGDKYALTVDDRTYNLISCVVRAYSSPRMKTPKQGG